MGGLFFTKEYIKKNQKLINHDSCNLCVRSFTGSIEIMISRYRMDGPQWGWWNYKGINSEKNKLKSSFKNQIDQILAITCEDCSDYDRKVMLGHFGEELSNF